MKLAIFQKIKKDKLFKFFKMVKEKLVFLYLDKVQILKISFFIQEIIVFQLK